MSYQLSDNVDEFNFIWKNNGTTPTGERLSISDALSTTHAPLLFPKVISRIVKEAMEPMLVGANLLTKIRMQYGQTITFPAIGALEADDIAEGQEYPRRSLDMGGGTVIAHTGKSGLAVSCTEEMIMNSQFDVMGWHLRQAGYALGRHKEKKIFNMIKALGIVAFDNLNPSRSAFGVTHGRNLNGQPNGSLIIDDIFDAWGQVVNQGFMPNTMLMHPLTWVMWVKDPVLRAFALQNGGGVFFATWNGNPAGKADWHDPMGVSGGQNIVPGKTPDGSAVPHSLTASGVLSYPQNITSAPQMPAYGNIPLVIIVSPFMFFDPARKLTDIFLFDRNNLGYLLTSEEVTTEDWNDPARDIRHVKLRERYTPAIASEGQAIAVFKNVFVRPNEIVLPAQATIEVSGPVQTISPSTPISI